MDSDPRTHWMQPVCSFFYSSYEIYTALTRLRGLGATVLAAGRVRRPFRYRKAAASIRAAVSGGGGPFRRDYEVW
jgi:hypothetical protein